MKCKDCEEHIGETERKAAIICKGCSKPMHGECAMYSESEDPFCEQCHRADAARWRSTMRAQGVLA